MNRSRRALGLYRSLLARLYLSNIYPLMGGSFDTEAEGGAACSFDFFAVDQYFKLYETGFRCCFSSDPTL